MDGDSIGGSVNLVMKQAPDKLRLFGSVGGGYNQMLSSCGQSNFSVHRRPPVRRRQGRRHRLGQRFGDQPRQPGRGGRLHADARPERAQPALVPGRSPARRASPARSTSSRATTRAFTIRGVFNRFIDDHENRQRVRYAGRQQPHRSRAARSHAHRAHRLAGPQRAARSSAASTTVDYQLLGAYSDQFDPLTMTTTFRETRVTFAPNVTATSIDPDNVQANPHQRRRRTTTTSSSRFARPTSPRTATSSASVNVRTPLQRLERRRRRS